MRLTHSLGPCLAFITACVTAAAQGAPDNPRARQWNAFAEGLVEVHEAFADRPDARQETRVGGYAGHPGYYQETSLYDAGGRLLSRLRRERELPQRLHAIEVYVRDPAGRLLRDYAASYLVGHHRAPVQTLINFHGESDGLVGYRQFDASGEHLYEHCRGQHEGLEVVIGLESWELPFQPPAGADARLAGVYARCLAGLPERVDAYLDPRVDLPAAADRDGEVERRTARGDALFAAGKVASALAEYERALELAPEHDDALFGSGMALGRLGRLEEAIAALDAYIARHAEDSRAHTKRGIRHFWNGDTIRAEHDMRRALELDPQNAEAHDDLGVILAQRGEHVAASEHFRRTLALEPSYQKAWHNLALIQHLRGRDEEALTSVDRALALGEAREPVLLKSAILIALDRGEEAATLTERADSLQGAGWSERAELTPGR